MFSAGCVPACLLWSPYCPLCSSEAAEAAPPLAGPGIDWRSDARPPGAIQVTARPCTHQTGHMDIRGMAQVIRVMYFKHDGEIIKNTAHPYLTSYVTFWWPAQSPFWQLYLETGKQISELWASIRQILVWSLEVFHDPKVLIDRVNKTLNKLRREEDSGH